MVFYEMGVGLGGGGRGRGGGGAYYLEHKMSYISHCQNYSDKQLGECGMLSEEITTVFRLPSK